MSTDQYAPRDEAVRHDHGVHMWKFFVYSFIGAFVLFVPFEQGLDRARP